MKACPFCKSEDVEHAIYMSSGQIECNKCGAMGPEVTPDFDIEAAEKLWDKRPLEEQLNVSTNLLDLRTAEVKRLVLDIQRLHDAGSNVIGDYSCAIDQLEFEDEAAESRELADDLRAALEATKEYMNDDT